MQAVAENDRMGGAKASDGAGAESSEENAVDRETLGRATWTFLHTLAAAYPERPSVERQRKTSLFMTLFAELYPCETCADGFQEIVANHPPRTQSNAAFARWMCEVHNEVNVSIGKPVYDCSRASERWGTCESCKGHEKELDDFLSIANLPGGAKSKK
ncbi:FAD-linked sulfhydryl oxidase ERV1 [Porphyridium purpureum]|uniref:Sulfhydryl oxidase n=1 Tax=Porphyridium purpureum TaxID=35688 RepID=A0A5J4YXE0_PORPP|nr:FAD-linked sulfhydryl oxidase ERV1 [Porphyridium purpureum]|eukprot:POR4927..scf209_3